MSKSRDKSYLKFISELKDQISGSRYQAARLVNREVLMLYHTLGEMIHKKLSEAKWGDKILENISEDLQNHFEGMRGFSVQNLKNMRLFFETYPQARSPESPVKKGHSAKNVIGQTVSSQLAKTKKNAIGQTVSSQLDKHLQEVFYMLGFSHHILLIRQCKSTEERFFYMQKASENNWAYRVLEYQIASNLYKKQGKLTHNFNQTLPKQIQQQAINAFKDEYLLNFLNIHEDDNEQVLEDAIITNIQKFLMSLGVDFSFIGRQYRLQVGKKEFFIDLLFYNRRLQAMVAIDLKTTDFDPRHAGQMDFYLTALDKQLKLEHENASIGIILCKDKDKTVVEYSLHSKQNPIGVAKYSYAQLPKKYREVLPNPKELSKFLN
ncbi:MAG: DUF1016 family protein [Bacteroidetes bacterium]|nr:DUF1016 family protein [Bacteroidota bacterium]